jgi:hypothetical protein
MDSKVNITLISTRSPVAAVAIPSIVEDIGIRKSFNKKKLHEELLQAYRDLKYINELEKQVG